jgi:hypothetical protein
MLTKFTKFTICLALTGCLHPSDAVESLCIKGRLSAEQATAVNAREWNRTPGYCAGQTYDDKSGDPQEGQSDCQAREFDRVLAADCSNFGKVLRHGD